MAMKRPAPRPRPRSNVEPDPQEEEAQTVEIGGIPNPRLLSNARAEASIVSALVQDGSLWPQVARLLDPEDFWNDASRSIYRTLGDMHVQGIGFDVVALVAELERAGELDAVGGDEGVVEILRTAPTTANVLYWANLVRDKATRRRAHEALDAVHLRNGNEHASAAEMIDDVMRSLQDLRSRATGPKGFDLGIIDSAELDRREIARDYIVDGLIVSGEPAVMGGPHKSLKTGTAIDVAVSVASGTSALGRFHVPRARNVLMLSGESGDGTIQETARRVCRSKGIELTDLEGKLFWGFTLPNLADPRHMDALATWIREHEVELVIIDPLYLCLLTSAREINPANLFDIGPLLKRITTTCLDAGATPLLSHHLKKAREDHHAAPELSELSYAGIQEFARQWLLLGRREKYVPGSGEHRLWLTVGGSAGHSGLWHYDVTEGRFDDEGGFLGRTWNVVLSEPETTQAPDLTDKVEKELERDRASEMARQTKIREQADRAWETLHASGPQTSRQWRDRLGMSGERFGFVQARLQAEKRIRETKIEKKNGHVMGVFDAWEAVPNGSEGLGGIGGTLGGTPGVVPPSRDVDGLVGHGGGKRNPIGVSFPTLSHQACPGIPTPTNRAGKFHPNGDPSHQGQSHQADGDGILGAAIDRLPGPSEPDEWELQRPDGITDEDWAKRQQSRRRIGKLFRALLSSGEESTE